jgi:multiple sugar transport system substrate-binding protein
MKSLRTIFIILMIIGINVTSLFAGGGQESKEAEAEVKELVFAGWAGEEENSRPIIEEMISTWNAQEENYQVKWVGWPWDKTFEQLTIRSQGGEPLDIIQSGFSWALALDEMEAVLNVSDVFSESWLEENLTDSALSTGMINGELKAIPWTLASIGTLYNPTILNNAGVSEVPTTIAEFEDALAKVHAYDKDLIAYGFCTKGTTLTSDFLPWLWTFGGEAIDDNGNVTINSEAGVETLTWLKSLVDKGYIKMDLDRFDIRTIYAQKQVAFYHDAIMAEGIAKTNGVPESELADTIQPMLLPVQKEGDIPMSSLWGHLLLISKNTVDIEKAAGFIKHIIGKEMSIKYFKKTGMLPVIKSAMAAPSVQNDPWSSKWVEITNTGKMSELNAYSQAQEMSTIIAEELQAALIASKTPQKALDDAKTRIENALQ